MNGKPRHRPYGHSGTSGKCQCGEWYGASVHLTDLEQNRRAVDAINEARKVVMDIGPTTDGNLDHPALNHLEAAMQTIYVRGG